MIRQLFLQSLLEEDIDRSEKTPQPAPVQAEERRILVVKATKKIGIVTEKIGAKKVFNSEDEFRIIPNKSALRSLILM